MIRTCSQHVQKIYTSLRLKTKKSGKIASIDTQITIIHTLTHKSEVLHILPLLTVGAIAAVIGCSTETVRRAIREGEIQAEKKGKEYVIAGQSAVNYLQSKGIDLDESTATQSSVDLKLKENAVDPNIIGSIIGISVGIGVATALKNLNDNGLLDFGLHIEK